MTLGRLNRLLLIAGLCAGIAGTLIAGNRLTAPARAQLGAPPPTLHARRVTFASQSGTILHGWFAPGESGRGAVVLLHPVRTNRRAMLGRALFLHRDGYAVLLIDLQAHGESDGERITFGYRESADAFAAVLQLHHLAPGEQLGALGVSLGAASLVFSEAHTLLSAMVLESMYPTIEEAVANRLRLYLGPLGPWLSPLLLWQLQWRLGITAEDLRPITRVSGICTPVLLVHGTADRHTTFREAERIFTALPAPKAMYAVEGAAHVDLHTFAGTAYEQQVGNFLARYLRNPNVTPGP